MLSYLDLPALLLLLLLLRVVKMRERRIGVTTDDHRKDCCVACCCYGVLTGHWIMLWPESIPAINITSCLQMHADYQCQAVPHHNVLMKLITQGTLPRTHVHLSNQCELYLKPVPIMSIQRCFHVHVDSFGTKIMRLEQDSRPRTVHDGAPFALRSDQLANAKGTPILSYFRGFIKRPPPCRIHDNAPVINRLANQYPNSHIAPFSNRSHQRGLTD
ncbi:hypothetical protein CAPTEDRAFT_208686 [Capitella teleta]|uniref:Secreted protein n=1 Tax=Capitella teleta TaxID=283909 RepID=R7TWR2_CAPTE|nr:hypothetical protein CAPTEDRAFT_208686 [Capitella teleta]|eukprot:ELT95410.1 hypothetical protein CAPTEDRAFT_208686 [Capitella teleta]